MNVGLIGCGYWGPNLLRNLYATGRCMNYFCFDSSPQTLAKVIAKNPFVMPAKSATELLGLCDAVLIATPVKAHYALARMALEAGLAVFVEKPLAASVVEGESLLSLARQKNLPLMTGHTFLYSPAVRKIREYVTSGVLGDIYALTSSRVNMGIHRKDVNVLWDLAPHDLSMLLYWLEESPCAVSAIARPCVTDNLDWASLQLQFPSGVVGTVEVSWLAPNKLRSTTLLGSKKMVVYDDTLANEKIKLYDRSAVAVEAPATFGEYQLTYRYGDLLSPWLDNTEPLLAQTNAFLDWVEFGVVPEFNTWIAMQVIAAIEAACRSLELDGARVRVAGTPFAPKMSAAQVAAAHQ